MARLPRASTAAGERYEDELNALKRSAKNQFVSQRITAGQLLFESGLGDFLLALDTQTFANATPEKRRELIELTFNTAARIIGGKAFTTANTDVMAPPATPEQVQEPIVIKQEEPTRQEVVEQPKPEPKPQEAASVTIDAPSAPRDTVFSAVGSDFGG